MNRLTFILRSLLMAGAAFWWAGCGDSQGPTEAESHPAGGHAHTAKYGGVLVELGEHEGNLEFVLDSAQGKLTVYVLDAHAENFVRLPLDAIAVTAQVDGTDHTLTLLPVGNAATGETPGNTSQFEAAADWLKSTPSLTVTLPELPVKSKTYRDVLVTLPNK